MSASTIEAIRKDLQAGKFKPVYALHGEEHYYIDRIADTIVNKGLEEHERDFNLTILYGRDSKADQVKDAALRYPMMAERQIVVVREAQQMKTLDALESYIQNPTPTTILVICHKHRKIDGRKSFGKKLKASKECVVVQSDKVKDYKISDWIKQQVTHLKRKIGVTEAQLLADHLGNDLSKVNGELEKLAVVIGEGDTITSDLIQQNVGISKDFNIFELQNALGGKDRTKVMRIARHFAQSSKEHPLVLTVSMLNNYFNRLAVYHELKDKSQTSVASALKINPYFVKDTVSAARSYSPEQLMRVQKELCKFDLKGKGVGNASTGDGELLRELLLRIMS